MFSPKDGAMTVYRGKLVNDDDGDDNDIDDDDNNNNNNWTSTAIRYYNKGMHA